MIIDNVEYLLVDDGTVDTVVSVQGEEIRFCTESAHGYRDDDGGFSDEGFRSFCEDVVAPTLNC